MEQGEIRPSSAQQSGVIFPRDLNVREKHWVSLGNYLFLKYEYSLNCFLE